MYEIKVDGLTNKLSFTNPSSWTVVNAYNQRIQLWNQEKKGLGISYVFHEI